MLGNCCCLLPLYKNVVFTLNITPSRPCNSFLNFNVNYLTDQFVTHHLDEPENGNANRCLASFFSNELLDSLQFIPFGVGHPRFVGHAALLLDELLDRVGPDDGSDQLALIGSGIFLLHCRLSPAGTAELVWSYLTERSIHTQFQEFN